MYNDMSHIDDLKVSHEDEKVMEEIFRHFNEKFGKESPLTTIPGKVYIYISLHDNRLHSKRQ